MKTFRRVVALSVLAILAGYETAAAEDFTFTVPLRFTALRAEVTMIAVSCMVGPGANFSPNDRVGSASTVATPDATGNYTGNVQLKFNAAPGKDPATATNYRCFFSLGGAGGATLQAGNPATLPKAGTTNTSFVSGALPQ